MIHDVKSFNVVLCDDGSVSVSYDGTLIAVPLIDYKTLTKKEKESSDLLSDLCSYTTRSWYAEHKGAKKGCGRRADAMILANAVRGMSFEEIQSQSYPYKNGATRRYNRQKIYNALSVKKPDDFERIYGLLEDFPEVFNGINADDVIAWIQKKASKGQGGKK